MSNTQETKKDARNIYQRLHAVMGDIRGVNKEDKMVNGQYKFVSHDAVTAIVREACFRHGILISPSITAHKQDGNRTEVDVRVEFINKDNANDRHAVDYFGYGVDPSDKGPGKAVSYATKYAMLKVFSLETGDDVERHNIDYEPAKAPEPEAKKGDSSLDDFLALFPKGEQMGIMNYINAICSSKPDMTPGSVINVSSKQPEKFKEKYEAWKQNV